MPEADRHLTTPPLLKADSALFLDFDGTLAELASRPDCVTVDRTLPDLLKKLSTQLAGAVAIITGRALAQADTLMGGTRFPGAGLHGAELRPDPNQAHPVVACIPHIAALAQTLRKHFTEDSRVIIEEKCVAVAVHYRLAPERAAECLTILKAFLGNAELEILLGHSVVEARPRGIDKGSALAALMQHPPFFGRTPIYAGDDITDEDALRTAQSLGGMGIKVGNAISVAGYRLAQVSDVHAWLRASSQQLEN